jgi:hypothetical protein
MEYLSIIRGRKRNNFFLVEKEIIAVIRLCLFHGKMEVFILNQGIFSALYIDITKLSYISILTNCFIYRYY